MGLLFRGLTNHHHPPGSIDLHPIVRLIISTSNKLLKSAINPHLNHHFSVKYPNVFPGEIQKNHQTSPRNFPCFVGFSPSVFGFGLTHGRPVFWPRAASEVRPGIGYARRDIGMSLTGMSGATSSSPWMTERTRISTGGGAPPVM